MLGWEYMQTPATRAALIRQLKRKLEATAKLLEHLEQIDGRSTRRTASLIHRMCTISGELNALLIDCIDDMARNCAAAA